MPGATHKHNNHFPTMQTTELDPILSQTLAAARDAGLTLIIGNKNYSSWSMRAWVALTAFNIPFNEVRILLDRPDTSARIAAQQAYANHRPRATPSASPPLPQNGPDFGAFLKSIPASDEARELTPSSRGAASPAAGASTRRWRRATRRAGETPTR